jgi:DNA-binding Xre family transcriptional regulator
MIVCRLAVLLKRRKWSLYRLRLESGVSYPTLLGLLHNRSRMYRADVLDKVCRALRCQVGDLLAWSNSTRGRTKKDKK